MKIIEQRAYDIYRDEILIRHIAQIDGVNKIHITYKVSPRKLKNPLTLQRYMNRSNRLFK